MNRRSFVMTTSAVAGLSMLTRTLHGEQQMDYPGGEWRVLFQGDSITDCGRDRQVAGANNAGGLGTGYPLLIASEALKQHPDRGFQFFNRGISGNRVPDLVDRWTTDTIALKPDVLSILIGVNDLWHKLMRGTPGTVEDYERGYAGLLERTRRELPTVRIVVLEPFVLRTGAVDGRWFPEFDQRRAAAYRVAHAAKATFIPLQEMFDRLSRNTPPQFWASDGVHPTPAGHAAIADLWRKRVTL